MSRDQYVPGTEGHLAAVWYAMKNAEADYHKNRARLERGQVNPWYYLKRMQALLGMGPTKKPYHIMRQELRDFAISFGVVGLHPEAEEDPHTARVNANAVKEFQES